jgi:CelD/BcsL family acetyltransferase involved in cellulose biosynthesis
MFDDRPLPMASRGFRPCEISYLFSMDHVLEISEIEPLTAYRTPWRDLLEQTPSASFFQSLEWLEAYWRYFGASQKLRVMVVMDDDMPIGVVPMVVLTEGTKVGRIRVLTYPLHAWGSFYGPIGPDPNRALAAALAHIRHKPRDWDLLELRWQGDPGTDLAQTRRVMHASGFSACTTVWDSTAMVDLSGDWDSYWAGRKSTWLQRYRSSERKLNQRGEISYVRYRPAGDAKGDGSPRWDLYDACEEIAKQSWQGSSTTGTTLSHATVREFLRETHAAAAAAGAVDLNLLLLSGEPVAFAYNYVTRGYVYGLRRGYNADKSRDGVGHLLMAHTIRDSFARGDHLYDLGIGSLKSKEPFQTRLQPIFRLSCFSTLTPRVQLLRLKRWWQERRTKRIAAGRVQNCTADTQ